jgi:peroxiredoxin
MHHWRKTPLFWALFLFALYPATLAADGSRLLGRHMPEWQLESWINSPPLNLAALKGRVVLIRWWTAPGCPYCKATAPALNEFHDLYQKRGLQVLGIYHHKSDTPLDPETVRSFTRQYQFEFPVAIDPDWRTLKRWWLDQGDHRWTSVTFLLDAQGKVRYIHPGGQYLKGDSDYNHLRAKVEELLQEIPNPSPPEDLK